VSGLHHAQAALPPDVRTSGTDYTESSVGPRAGLDAVAKAKINLIIASAGN